MTQTTREKVAAELAIAKSAAETKRARGESDKFEQGEIGRLRGELDRLNEINEDPRYQAYVHDMNKRHARERADRKRAAVQRQNREERLFNEQLQAHYEERLDHYRLTRPGVPKEVFDKEVWPKLRSQFIAGEEDDVDQERREKATSVF